MKCPNCYQENDKGRATCHNCGEDLTKISPDYNPEEDFTPKETVSQPKKRAPSRFFRFIGRLIAGIFNFILYVVVLIVCIAAVMAVLFYQCRVNIPIPPDWEILPKVVVNYWNWADEWQMERCPKLTPDNYFFGNEPIPKFDEEGELILEPECADAVITFDSWNAPAGTTFTISLDNFKPGETVEACWYYPSNALNNCATLTMDENGHEETVYFSSDQDPRGEYRMEVSGECPLVSTEWTIN